MANRSRVWIKIKFSFSSRRVLNFSKRKKYHERRKRRFEIFVLLFRVSIPFPFVLT